MKDVLTQEEVDALLRDVSNGNIETGKGPRFNPEDVKDFDLSAMESTGRDSKPDIEFVNEVFARYFQHSIRKLLNDQLDVTAGDTRLEKFADYIVAQSRPTSLNATTVPQLDGQVMFVLDSHLILNYVNLYFGGGLSAPVELDRDFTATETGVARKLLGQACTNLAAAWQGIISMEFENMQTESNPKFSTAFSPTDVLVVSKFDIQMEEEPLGMLEVLIPTSCLAPLKKQLENSNKGDQLSKQARWSAILEQHVKGTNVELSSVLTTLKVNLRDLVRLRPGDILPIELPETVELATDTVPLFKGTFGTANGHNAIHITERIT